MSMSPKELAEYAKVCRKNGIASLEIDGVKLTITLPTSQASKARVQASDEIETEPELDFETLATWSSTPLGE